MNTETFAYVPIGHDTLIDADFAMRSALAVQRRANSVASFTPATASLVMVGIAAAGVSRPAPLTDGGERLPEVVTPAAWEAVRSDIQAGAVFDFRIGHDGKPFARSNDAGVRITFDPVAGLLFTIDGVGERGRHWPAFGCCSIGFAPINVGKRYLRGTWTREVRRMQLRHVAVAPANRVTAYYPQARARCVAPEQAARALMAIRLDARVAAREAGL
jgi:hypothetical protein